MPAKAAKKTTKRKATEALFESYGLPGWLGWGTAGAESTYGTNGNYAFGGIDLPNSGNGSYWIEARESAKAYAGLVKQYGSVEAAIPHYSGNSYTISHVKSLAAGGGSTGGEAVDASFFSEFLGKLAGPAGEAGTKALESAGVDPAEAIPEALNGVTGGILEPIIQPFTTIAEVFKVVGELLFTPEGWLRIAKMVGGAIFFVWGLEKIMSGAAPSHGPVSSLAKDAAVAAIVK